jgi:hypothetical protein
MTLVSTFIPTQKTKDLLCALYAEYNCAGDTRSLLYQLRDDLGADQFGRFQQDMARLLNRPLYARRALETILRAAVARAQQKFQPTQLRQLYQPA